MNKSEICEILLCEEASQLLILAYTGCYTLSTHSIFYCYCTKWQNDNKCFESPLLSFDNIVINILKLLTEWTSNGRFILNEKKSSV